MAIESTSRNVESESTETTSLLRESNSSTTSAATQSSNSRSDGSVVGAKSLDGNDHSTDEEAGETEQPENPMFEGNPEMLARMHLLFPAVAIGVLMSAADQTLVVSSYARIGSDLNALNNTSWIATAYFLTLTSFQPLYGKLSDIFGRKPALLFAYTIFGTGCLFCGLARTLEELVAARAFAGIGGGGLTTVMSILLSDIVPLRKRGSWQGYVNIVYAVGASAGAPLGGILADSIGWRWAFLAQVPMCVLAIVAVYLLLDISEPEQSHWLSKLRKVDFLGAFTLVLAVFFLLLGMDHGANVSWASKFAIISCAVSIPLFALFIFIEMKIASHPFAPGHVILARSLIASYLTNFFGIAANMGAIFYFPLYLQAVDGLSATGAGLRLVPVMILSVTGSLSGGIYMQRTGRYYRLTIGCVFIGLLGIVMTFCSTGQVLSSTPLIIAGLCVSTFGMGAAVTTTLLSVLANADPADQAIATACSYLFRSLGSVTGVSIAATVVQQQLRTRLSDKLDSGKEADEITERVRQNLDFIKTLEPGMRAVVRGCYQAATNASFAVSIGIMACALIASTFIREKRLSK